MNYRVGIFRIWVVSSLLWIGFTLWSQDFLCMIGVDIFHHKPWCDFASYVEPMKVWSDFIVLLIGPPTLIGLLLGFVVWIVSGFKAKR